VRKRQSAGLGAQRGDEPGRLAEGATLTVPTSTQAPKPSQWLFRLPPRSWPVYGVAITSVIVLVIGLAALLTR